MEILKNYYNAHKKDLPNWQEFTIIELSQLAMYLGGMLGYQRENSWITAGTLGLGIGTFVWSHITWLRRVRSYQEEFSEFQ